MISSREVRSHHRIRSTPHTYHLRGRCWYWCPQYLVVMDTLTHRQEPEAGDCLDCHNNSTNTFQADSLCHRMQWQLGLSDTRLYRLFLVEVLWHHGADLRRARIEPSQSKCMLSLGAMHNCDSPMDLDIISKVTTTQEQKRSEIPGFLQQYDLKPPS